MLLSSEDARPVTAVMFGKRFSMMAIGMVASLFWGWVERRKEGGVDCSSREKSMHSIVCINKNTNSYQT